MPIARAASDGAAAADNDDDEDDQLVCVPITAHVAKSASAATPAATPPLRSVGRLGASIVEEQHKYDRDSS